MTISISFGDISMMHCTLSRNGYLLIATCIAMTTKVNDIPLSLIDLDFWIFLLLGGDKQYTN